MIKTTAATTTRAKAAAAMGAAVSAVSVQSHGISVGAAYLIRTVTMTYTGRVVAVTDADIALVDAAWIASTGRYSEAVAKGTLDEVEAYPDGMVILIGRGGIIDMVPWLHDLPRRTK